MDGVLCHHRTPRLITKGPGGVLDGKSLDLSLGWSDVGSTAEYTHVRGGTGAENSRGLPSKAHVDCNKQQRPGPV